MCIRRILIHASQINRTRGWSYANYRYFPQWISHPSQLIDWNSPHSKQSSPAPHKSIMWRCIESMNFFPFLLLPLRNTSRNLSFYDFELVNEHYILEMHSFTLRLCSFRFFGYFHFFLLQTVISNKNNCMSTVQIVKLLDATLISHHCGRRKSSTSSSSILPCWGKAPYEYSNVAKSSLRSMYFCIMLLWIFTLEIFRCCKSNFK